MSLTDLSEEIFEKQILQYLDWNDFLRFRRVCSWSKRIISGYLKDHPELAPPIEINEGKEKTFQAFIKMGIPTCRLVLNNPSGHIFFEKNEKIIPRFLEEFGSNVKELRICQLSVYPRDEEISFIDGLVNLKSFAAEYFGFGERVDCPRKSKFFAKEIIRQTKIPMHLVTYSMPQMFTTLEVLKIGQDEHIGLPDLTYRTGGLLHLCPGLKYAALPFGYDTITKTGLPIYDGDGVLAKAFVTVEQYIDIRNSRIGKPNLEFYDFANYHDDYQNVERTMLLGCYGSRDFVDLCVKAKEYGVKLVNVSSFWFCLLETTKHYLSKVETDIGLPVVSLFDLHPSILLLEMPNLEKIVIRSTQRSIATIHQNDKRPKWSALRILDVTIDFQKISKTWEYSSRSKLLDFNQCSVSKTSNLFKFLFGNITRVNITDLRLKFQSGQGNLKNSGFDLPKPEAIVASCPNLKKLQIRNWPGTNKALVMLWNGIPGLEEISLEFCGDLGNVAFVGEDIRSPVFLKLKNLKTLSLKGLDRMPKITDTLFLLVLANMNLSNLILTSDEPLKNITVSAIDALLEGKFGRTIQKFPFTGWSLANVSEEILKKMETKFRSFNML